MALEVINLEKWKFALGENISCLESGKEVTVPHTWNIEDGTEEFRGIGWYEYCFVPEDSWKDKRIYVQFRAVYHDAYVYVNGKEVGIHQNSGYTPFVVELTDAILYGQENCLGVKVDNRFSKSMLPYDRSFDWANDGGMIRPAQILITGKSTLKDIKITSHPVITSFDERQDQGMAVFGVQAQIDGQKENLSLEWTLYEGCDGKLTTLHSGIGQCKEEKAIITGKVLDDIKYWHFDAPNLYTFELTLKNGEVVEDKQNIVFGFRDFHVQGSRIYLNGEPVRVTGTEWMPGSDPSYGMAETKEQLEKMLLCLKESNSVLTRFHWQQDEWVYDWCDRHGILVQEEIPFWGADPRKAGSQQWKVFTEQTKEMISAHRNHPSIIAWGVGNELDGQCEETIQYIKDAVAYTHSLDPERAANYVSNSIYKDHAKDGTTDGDIMMVNDYIGTWHGSLEQYDEWDKITSKNPDKPVIPSEFGLCEPAFAGGDVRRTEIFLEKMQCYRKYLNIAGTIYFCLNDYRTQMGEDGEGKLRKRVHGSTDLCGEPKPSYHTVKKEYSPVLLRMCEDGVEITCRNDLPAYSVRGYSLKVNGTTIEILNLKPGECQKIKIQLKDDDLIEVYRPNGEKVL